VAAQIVELVYNLSMGRIAWGGIVLAVGVFLLPAFAHACDFYPIFVDVNVIKTGDKQVTAGENIVYTIDFSAKSSQTGPGIVFNHGVFRDVVPAGLTFVSGKVNAPISNAGCELKGNTVECKVPDLLWKATYTLTFKTEPNKCQTINNVVTFTSDVTGEVSTSTATTQVVGCAVGTPTPSPSPTPTTETNPKPGLKIVKSDGDRSVTHPEDGFAYELTATNTGETDLDDVVISDTVPAPFKIVGVSSGGSFSGQVATWKNIELAVEKSKKVTITVQTLKEAKTTDKVCNVGKADSAKKDLHSQAEDCIAIKDFQVKAAKKVVPKQVPVTVTAKTGAGLTMMATSILGGLAWPVIRMIKRRK